jgi:GT2 family glycosyltransferase
MSRVEKPLTVALCVITHERPTELRYALESAEDDTWDEIVVLDMASDPPIATPPGARLLRLETNVGAPAGRNRIAEAVTSDIMVFVDDDAVLKTEAAEAVRRHFALDDRLALIAFKVVRSGGDILSSEFPFRGPVCDPDLARPCAYFLAGGYASRRTAVEDAGGYDERFLIYSEELDLSYRLLARGWKLWYEPTISVEHRPSAFGRSVSRPSQYIQNRWITMRRFLPWPLLALHMAIWSAITGVQAARAGGISQWARGWLVGIRTPVERHPLKLRQLREIHRIGGRVIW